MSDGEERGGGGKCAFDKSMALFERAARVIPGGIYGHLSPIIRTPGATPYYAASAQGARFRDVDGNEFIDWLCAYGPMVVGYNNPRVEEAAEKQRKLGDCASVPGGIMVELAEFLVELIPFADWALFAKNGSDMTTWALQVARAHTGRRKIIMVEGTYHGAHAWCTPGHAGLVPGDRENILTFKWNDIVTFKKLVDEHEGQIAGAIMTPYHFPNWSDSVLPQTGFWTEVQAVCNRKGIVLILDDVRTCYRLHLQGSQELFRFRPDLSVHCKALANGYPLSACLGRKEFKNAASKVFATGSYWFSSVPMAASMATIKELKENDGVETMYRIGKLLWEGLEGLAKERGLTFALSGNPTMPYARFTNDNDLFRNQAFCAEMNRRGIFVHPHHNWFVSTAHTEKDVEITLEAADASFRAVKEKFGD
ncbi:MAG: aminotransferase class III-fold pyridoxal phosphate-dependent enzyme [bacterium]